jgi:hypothetical protein
MPITRLSDKERNKLREYLLEGNDPEDLADLYIDQLSAIELKELMKEASEGDS